MPVACLSRRGSSLATAGAPGHTRRHADHLALMQMLDWGVNFGGQTTSFLALVSRER